MKKNVMGIVLIIIILGSTLVLANNSDGSANAKSDEQIESELLKSMEETKNEKEKIEKLFTRSSKALKDEGFREVGLSYSNEERILIAQVNDKDLLDDNKGQIENIIVNTAKEVGFNDFVITFSIVNRNVSQNNSDQKLMESIHKVSKVVSNELKNRGYNLSYSISVKPEKEIIIEGTDKGFAGNEELEKLISNAILSKTNLNYAVKLKKKSESEMRDMEWHPIFTAISEETNKKFNEYRGFASSFHPQPLQIIIKTKINNNWFKNSDERVKEIENYVERIIDLKIEELSIEEIPYEIIIRDKNNKKIN